MGVRFDGFVAGAATCWRFGQHERNIRRILIENETRSYKYKSGDVEIFVGCFAPSRHHRHHTHVLHMNRPSFCARFTLQSHVEQHSTNNKHLLYYFHLAHIACCERAAALATNKALFVEHFPCDEQTFGNGLTAHAANLLLFADRHRRRRR